MFPEREVVSDISEALLPHQKFCVKYAFIIPGGTKTEVPGSLRAVAAKLFPLRHRWARMLSA